jgi:hypothetical protein
VGSTSGAGGEEAEVERGAGEGVYALGRDYREIYVVPCTHGTSDAIIKNGERERERSVGNVFISSPDCLGLAFAFLVLLSLLFNAFLGLAFIVFMSLAIIVFLG